MMKNRTRQLIKDLQNKAEAQLANGLQSVKLEVATDDGALLTAELKPSDEAKNRGTFRLFVDGFVIVRAQVIANSSWHKDIEHYLFMNSQV